MTIPLPARNKVLPAHLPVLTTLSLPLLLSLIQSLHSQVQLPSAAKHVPVLSTKDRREIQWSESMAFVVFLDALPL